MGGPTTKEQLGARVPPSVRQLAVRAADALGVSQNEWIERAILHYASEQGIRLDTAVVPGQTTLEDFAGEPEPVPSGPVDSGDSGSPAPARILKGFDPECRNRAYHFTRGPDNPCRFCGGEA